MLRWRKLLLRAMTRFTVLFGIAFFAGVSLHAATLRVNGSTTVNPVVTEAAEILRSEDGMAITVDTQGGSSGGIAALGDGLAEIAMASRPLEIEDREKFSKVDFVVTIIGHDGVALVVSKDVHDGGVTSLSREEARGIYEGKIKNWNEVGGPDQRIIFFNKEPGRGTWEVFAHWAYDKNEELPLVNHPEVGGNEEGRNKTGSTRGAITQLSASWADNETVFALAVESDGGILIPPTGANVSNGTYPMARPLNLMTDGTPTADAAKLIDFILGDRGQALVRKNGYLGLKDTE